MALLRRSVDQSLLALIEESGRNVVRTALLLRELISDRDEVADYIPSKTVSHVRIVRKAK